jgi:transposase InsO family protein
MVGLKNNSEKSILSAKSWYNGSLVVYISLFTDNLEFRYQAFQAKLRALGIEQYFTALGHSSSNEAAIGVVRTTARAMMRAKDLPADPETSRIPSQ